MKSTIEKALARQQEAKKKELEKKQAEQVTTEEVTLPNDESIGAPVGASEAPKQANAVPGEKRPFKLNFQQLDERGFVSLVGNRRQINEEYREIKRKLLSNAFGPLAKTLHNSNIIMVTSSRPSEGKTFSATNLALSIASEQDKTVLLVDADVLKPNVLNTLKLERRNGLMEYLMGEVDDIADVIYPTNLETLKIIPAGRFHHKSTELLASQRMHDIVDEFANRYSDRVVVIDTPPLIGITETAVLANFAGQAMVVIEEGRTKLNDIRFAVDRLNPDMAIGFVVNKSVEEDAFNGYYGYYYSDRE
ncbi:XrtA-associated tyrosine autokinase [Alteromonas sp. H39]|uniref:XrtA-associated tyrosine autokinase n=1 Tax=Alteromonas sp. H39 TaxID=3389876 RepID=UPI0039E1E8A9